MASTAPMARGQVLITGELPEELLSMLTQAHAELTGDTIVG